MGDNKRKKQTAEKKEIDDIKTFFAKSLYREKVLEHIWNFKSTISAQIDFEWFQKNVPGAPVGRFWVPLGDEMSSWG